MKKTETKTKPAKPQFNMSKNSHYPTYYPIPLRLPSP